jgi:hypothetical protein
MVVFVNCIHAKTDEQQDWIVSLIKSSLSKIQIETSIFFSKCPHAFYSGIDNIWRNLEGFFAPRHFDTELILNNQVKYLGVILNSKLNWKFYIDNRIWKVTIAYWQCHRAIGKAWGLKPKVGYWIYTSVIRPMLTYAVLVWWRRTHLTTVKNQFGHIQRFTCLGMTG